MLHKRAGAVRQIYIAVTVILLLVSLLANAESVSAASDLKVTVTDKTIYVGQTAKLKANMKVKWSVSKTKTAKLISKKNKTVKVKGLKAGTVYVLAKAGSQTEKIKIKVKDNLSLTASRNVIGLGEYCSIYAWIGKSSVDSKKLTYSSSDKDTAFIDENGLVQGFKVGTATITVKSNSDPGLKAKIKIKVVPARAGTVTATVDMTDESRYPAGRVARVWLPIPQNDDNQSIAAIKFDKEIASVTYDSAGGKQLYIEWGADTKPADRKTTLSFHVYRRAVVDDGKFASREKGTVDTEKFADELKETMWSGSLSSGIVKVTADKIVADAKAATVYDKAFAIYDWVCDNVVRIDDKTVIFGDVVSMLEGKRQAGSCMDVNSIFVALCRAEGIPARNTFGMRFAPKYGPNCRAEFYLPGCGWLTADPALAIKQSWGHEEEYIGEGAKESSVWKGIKAKYWINAEENWLCNNRGRDIWLEPKQSVDTGGQYLDVLNPDGSLNLFMFPYGEFDGQYIPCMKAGEFKYTYSFAEEDPTDCGC